MRKYYLFPLIVISLCGAASNLQKISTDNLKETAIHLLPSCASSVRSLHPSKKNWKDCDKLEKIASILKKRNWCWGPDTVSNAEKDWMPCSDPKSQFFPFT